MIALSALMLCSAYLYAPPNCEIYKTDENCYAACQAAMTAISYRQGSYRSQQYFDEAIDLCNNFAYAYQEKAVPYLKRGKFIEWKRLIDKAVELEPTEYLGYRGWCRLQFLRDYAGAIADIELLKNSVNYDIGYCQTGDYHLEVALALCYKESGNLEKARSLLQNHLTSAAYSEGMYDYYHLGVLEYEAENFTTALAHFAKQISVNDYLAETYYFMALCHKKLKEPEACRQNLMTAEEYYRAGKIRTDTYAEPVDKIYLLDILAEKKFSNRDF